MKIDLNGVLGFFREDREMFAETTYIRRRDCLKKEMGSGLILFLGNEEVPMNYPANPYYFRQDSSFLYYLGLDNPGLAAVVDLDEDREIILGNDISVKDVVWTGPQSSISEKSEQVGVRESAPLQELKPLLIKAIRGGRKVHFLPPYRAEGIQKISDLLGIHSGMVKEYASEELMRAVVAQRSVKSDEEIAQIEMALDITYEMHTTAMRLSKPGMREYEIAGLLAGISRSRNGNLAFPIVFTIHGETLHNFDHKKRMEAGHLAVHDSGVESPLHYASDITRTFPVAGKFTQKQRELYELVLNAQVAAIDAIRPGVMYRDVHLLASRTIAEGLKGIGLMKGNIEDAVKEGAHALFFTHGIGHLLGLDVHDMENFGEDNVGYDESVQRSDQFGLAYLRLAKKLEQGFVVTVEPGIYFIPALIDKWKGEGRFTDFISYAKVEQYRDFGGIRIEDDILVTENGCRVLGKPIPRTIEEVEAASRG